MPSSNPHQVLRDRKIKGMFPFIQLAKLHIIAKREFRKDIKPNSLTLKSLKILLLKDIHSSSIKFSPRNKKNNPRK